MTFIAYNRLKKYQSAFSTQSLLLLSIFMLLTACYPTYKTIQPAAKVQVLNQQHQPIEGAKVVLITRAHPTPINDHTIQLTNAQGLAVFNGHHEMQTETIFLHGALDYYWSWCIEKAGFATYQSAGAEFKSNLNVELLAGESTSCAADSR